MSSGWVNQASAIKRPLTDRPFKAQIDQLIEKRKYYQVMIYNLKEGANQRYYENLLSKNSQALLALNANVFDIDDANRREVKEWAARMANLPPSKKLFGVLRYWSPVILIAAVILYAFY